MLILVFELPVFFLRLVFQRLIVIIWLLKGLSSIHGKPKYTLGTVITEY